jgi:hypothetical protein
MPITGLPYPKTALKAVGIPPSSSFTQPSILFVVLSNQLLVFIFSYELNILVQLAKRLVNSKFI